MQPRERRVHLRVGLDEPVVVGDLELAVPGDEAVHPLTRRAEPPEHRLQRHAEVGEPFRVGRHGLAAALERVASRLHDEVDGIDQRAVEVEEDRFHIEGEARAADGYLQETIAGPSVAPQARGPA